MSITFAPASAAGKPRLEAVAMESTTQIVATRGGATGARAAAASVPVTA
jgi:hypothetical protein